MTATSSEGGFFEFRGNSTDDFIQDFVNTGLGCCANVKLGVIKFWVARKVVGIINVFVSVQSLTEDLESRMTLADNAKSEFVLLFLEHCH
jgi:hypothetical protein